MHLTNYAVNKKNPDFIFNSNENDDSIGHKRSLTSVLSMLEKEGQNIDLIMKNIKQVVIKTFCSV